MQDTDTDITHEEDTIQEAFRLSRKALKRLARTSRQDRFMAGRTSRQDRFMAVVYARLAMDNISGALVRKFWDGRKPTARA